MSRVGLYTATDNELGTIERAAADLETALVVRAAGDLDDPADTEAFVDDLVDATAVIFWLHGAEDSLPGYDRAVARLAAADVPLVVVATGDAFAVEDTTVAPAVRERVSAYLDRGGASNIANGVRSLRDAVGPETVAHDDPVALPTEGVYHPDHPGITYDALRATFDPDAPTVAVWFYESHWTHENTRYVDAQVRALEAQGANVLPIFCNPAGADPDERDAEWVVDTWLREDGETVVDAVCSSFMFSLSMDERGQEAGDEGEATAIFLERLGVPVLQTITTMRTRADYADSATGVMGFELALSVALPEFDGALITHPISGKERTDDGAEIGTAPARHLPIDDRVDHAARLAVNWARLAHLDNAEKRVAVVLHNYPPSDDGIGTAFGLDTPESVVTLLEALADRGYDLGADPDAPAAAPVPDSGQALIERLIAQLTLDDRWIAPADVRERSVDVVEPGTYADWFAGLDDRFQAAVREEWGAPPDRPIAIPGVAFGNVLVTVQPPRGFGMDPSTVYHDADLQPPHDYVAFYAWLRHAFAADGVVHLGTHGSLEWLPGKTVGLDGASAPDQLIDDLPNVYPYIVNNPGEGAQAKRRSYAAVVDHLTPVMGDAGTYDDLAALEELADRYREAGTAEARPDDGVALTDRIRERVADLDLAVDLGLAEAAVADVDVDDLVERVHAYLTDIKTTQIRLGLHTLSEPPDGERLVEYLVALTRLANPGAPSLRESVAGTLGVDYDAMCEAPGTYDADLGMTYAQAADAVRETCLDLVGTLADHDFDVPASERETGPEAETTINRMVVDLKPLGESRAVAGAPEDLRRVLAYICEEAVPRVRGARKEIPRTVSALDGNYVPPGGSGAPTRGGVDLLPTARNFYTLDPRKVPARPAWAVGREVAEGVAERHRESEGAYPEEVGVVAWGTPTVRTRGETIAQVLALMGVEPEWSEAGRVEDVSPIPLDELGRPRIDVTTRVSGLFRDAFPQAAGVIHDAVEAVVDLDEPHDRNYVKKHVERAAADLADQEGLDADGARTAATHRVFTTRPGGYGAGTNKLVDEGNWDERGDLADVYVQWGGYAMGDQGDVTEAHAAFERRLGTVEATVKLEDTAEQDEFDSADWYAFHGGFVSAVAEQSGAEPAAYVGDSANPDDVAIYTTEEKVRKAMRARVLNPRWLDSMADHDYKGAGDLASTVDVVLGWDATTGVVSDALWDDVAAAYAFDADRQDWLRDVNPWALERITDTLLEAIERGLWDADEATQKRLQDCNLTVEGDLEARAGEAPPETVGPIDGASEVSTNDD